jgi:hypothetical protein
MVSRRWERIAAHYEEVVWLFAGGLVRRCCVGTSEMAGRGEQLRSGAFRSKGVGQ